MMLPPPPALIAAAAHGRLVQNRPDAVPITPVSPAYIAVDRRRKRARAIVGAPGARRRHAPSLSDQPLGLARPVLPPQRASIAIASRGPIEQAMCVASDC
jgi:hypothetical protein